MGRRAVLLIVAALIAAAGTALVLLYVQGIDARATAEQQPVRVLTATVRIDAGESMSAAQAEGKIDLVEWPRAKVLPSAVSSAEDFQDQVALSTIYPGEQIIPEKFGGAGQEDVLSIPKGKLAISVQLTDPSRVAGFVKPGSEVAIYATLPTISKVILPKVPVIGVGQTTVLSTTKTTAEGEETTEEIPKTILTVGVTHKEAEKVFLAGANGELAFGLRNDKSVTGASEGTLLTDVFGAAHEGAN